RLLLGFWPERQARRKFQLSGGIVEYSRTSAKSRRQGPPPPRRVCDLSLAAGSAGARRRSGSKLDSAASVGVEEAVPRRHRATSAALALGMNLADTRNWLLMFFKVEQTVQGWAWRQRDCLSADCGPAAAWKLKDTED
uniref:PH domain-containing protein n=1 Tax=Macrostomum lignano TaxID=282301 RepID=A0A1I8F9I6_9PLAT